ncbi:tyrosine kinase receptor Cad96Ca-like isoform X1 [Macrobrachium rosenbergii]|uniref:tyrosine kinase receptor Cad96Ca-like isoform X1 n=1 Tax=Macrobrachium rosenbergii TaxID=79674 RepID=UPI0034D5E322
MKVVGVMDIAQAFILCIIFVPIKGIFGANSPPSLDSEKHWVLYENDEIGHTVTTLRARDSEQDPVYFTLESKGPGPDIHTYFTVDENNRVKVAKNLTGLAVNGNASFILVVRLHDGTTSPIVEVRVDVKKSGNGKSRGRPSWITENSPFSNLGFPSRTPPVIPPLLPQPSAHVPPQLLVKNREWVVYADDPVGRIVDIVTVKDLSGEGYNLTFVGSPGFLEVDHFGKVRVAKPLVHVKQNYTLTLRATNHGAFSEEDVYLVVLPPKPSTSTSTSTSTITTTVILEHPSETSSTSIPKSKPNSDRNNSQDLRVVGGNSGSLNNEGSGPVSEGTEEAPEGDISLTVVPIVLIAGISPLALALYCYWRRIQRRKARAEAKESVVVYTEKAEEDSTSQVPPRRNKSSSRHLTMLALFRKRAQSNKYEDDVRAGNEIDKRKLSEVAPTEKDCWEFPRHHLKFVGILGEGCFGQVWKCEAVGMSPKGPMLVAVKTLKECAGDRERRDLVQELKVLKNLGKHVNVVSLLGCCSEKDPIFIILEYMVGGKLQSYLRASRADASYNNLHGASSSLTPRDLTLFTYQIARGMEFLARNGIIHRDLAARNVLVGEDKVCKVADFGFARDVANNHIYARKSDGRLPIRWMAPESLFDNIFTTKSDVWSFGVLLWEIVTLGSTPYPGLGAAEVMKRVKEGYRLEKPDHCRREIYNIMYYCWDKDPKERPCFTELVHTLEGLLLSEVEYIELDRFPDHSYYNVVTEKSDELL